MAVNDGSAASRPRAVPRRVSAPLRRLDAFLKHHGLLHTAYTLEMESRVLFEPTRLQVLVTQGKWSEADRYLRCFSALWKDDGDGAAQYTALQGSLNFNAVLAWLACRGEEGGRAAARFKPPSDAFRKADPEAAKLKDIYCSMTSQQASYYLISYARSLFVCLTLRIRFVLCNLIAGNQ